MGCAECPDRQTGKKRGEEEQRHKVPFIFKYNRENKLLLFTPVNWLMESVNYSFTTSDNKQTMFML